MKEYIYVLREDMYNEWAWECGATTLISTSYNLSTILKELRKYMIFEKVDKRIIGDDIENQDFDSIIQDVKTQLVTTDCVSVNIYVDKEDYDNGKESGVLVIEKIEVKH